VGAPGERRRRGRLFPARPWGAARARAGRAARAPPRRHRPPDAAPAVGQRL